MSLYDTIRRYVQPVDVPPDSLEGMDRVYVQTVVDGDTIDVVFGNGKEERVRFVGVDTPESYGTNTLDKWQGITDTAILDSWGKKAKQYTYDHIYHQYVYLRYDPIAGERGVYGRILAYVYLPDGTNFNGKLIQDGYARLYTASDCEFYSAFQSYENEARRLGLGVWSMSESAHKDGVLIMGLNAYAEYVKITNYTGSVVVMTGWHFVDSSNTRYTFPDSFYLAPDATVLVYTASGENTLESLYWGYPSNVWNNDGDACHLYDSHGVLVDSFFY